MQIGIAAIIISTFFKLKEKFLCDLCDSSAAGGESMYNNNELISMSRGLIFLSATSAFERVGSS